MALASLCPYRFLYSFNDLWPLPGTRLSGCPLSRFYCRPGNIVGPFRTVLQPDSTAPATYVLEAVVTELYGDFRPEQPPIAVMTVQFSLVDLQGLAPQTRLEQTISRRIELPEDTPNALVKAYGQALNEILTELAQQMARQNLALQTLPRNA